MMDRRGFLKTASAITAVAILPGGIRITDPSPKQIAQAESAIFGKAYITNYEAQLELEQNGIIDEMNERILRNITEAASAHGFKEPTGDPQYLQSHDSTDPLSHHMVYGVKQSFRRIT